MKPTDLQSKVIAFMRFPLLVLLLFLHCNFTTLGEEWASLPFASHFINIFSQRVAPIVFPVSFFIAGYLFFKTGQFSSDIYLKKLIHRVQSLLVPFFLWNLLYLLLAIIIGLFTGEIPILGILYDNLTFTDGLKSFWDISLIAGGNSIAAPIAVQFWFVRDLMVTMVCSPIIYFAVKWFITLSGRRPLVRYLLFLAIVFALGYCPHLTAINPDGWLFFAYGAYFGIKKKEFIVAMLPYALPSFIVLAIVIGIEQLIPCEFIYRLEYVVGLIFVISFTTVMVRAGTWYVNMTLANGSFFIFSYHYMVLGFIIWLLGSSALAPHSAWLALLYYVLAVIIVVFLGLLFYWLMRTRLPFITYILMGGRR